MARDYLYSFTFELLDLSIIWKSSIMSLRVYGLTHSLLTLVNCDHTYIYDFSYKVFYYMSVFFINAFVLL